MNKFILKQWLTHITYVNSSRVVLPFRQNCFFVIIYFFQLDYIFFSIIPRVFPATKTVPDILSSGIKCVYSSKLLLICSTF